MKVTNGQLNTHLNELKTFLDKQTSVKTGYAFQKNIRRFEEELRPYEEERIRMLKKYGKKDEKGELILNENGSVDFENGGYEKFAEELKKLQELEIDVPVYQVSLNDLEQMNLTVRELYCLDFMIAEETASKE